MTDLGGIDTVDIVLIAVMVAILIALVWLAWRAADGRFQWYCERIDADEAVHGPLSSAETIPLNSGKAGNFAGPSTRSSTLLGSVQDERL